MMKRLILVAFLLLSALPAQATIALVQKNADAATSATSPISVSLPSTVAGNSIIVVVMWHSTAASTASISDGVNTYSSTSKFTNGTNNTQVFYALSGVGGSLTISVTLTNLSSGFVSAREYSSNGLSADGATGTASPGHTATPTSDSITTTGSGLLIGAMTDFNAATGGAGSSWGDVGKNTNFSALICISEDKLNKSSGTYSSDFTLSSAESDWIAMIAAFKETGGAAAPAGMNKREKLELLDP